MPTRCSLSSEVRYRSSIIADELHQRNSIVSDGRKEYAMFDKITSRIMKLSEGLDLDYVDPVRSPCRSHSFHPREKSRPLLLYK